MSNPVLTIGNSIPVPADPEVIRTTYTRIVYSSEKFYTYGKGEFDPTYTTYDPTKMGEEFYIFIRMDNALGPGGLPPGVKPDFVTGTPTTGSWSSLKEAPSGFITAVNSVMPRIIVPSEILVDNGIKTYQNLAKAVYKDGGVWKDLFNWELVTLNTTPILDTDTFKYAQIAGYHGSQYVSSKAKDDTVAENTMIMKLENPPSPPLGSAHDWLKADSSNLVVGGAFELMLNIVPSRAATADPADVAKKKWKVTIEFGEVVIIIDDTGSSDVSIGDTVPPIPYADHNTTKVNLAQGKGKMGPPQVEHIHEKEPYILLVYPVWNGLVIASGVQDAYATVFSSSYFVPKIKKASIRNAPYSVWFDPTAPAAVEVNCGTAVGNADWVLVDFGSKMTLTAENCRFDAAYVPCFFSKKMWFDEWRLQNDDNPGTVSYTYDVYPIWTKNNTASSLTPVPTVIASTFAGTVADTHYTYEKWRLEQDHYNRYAGEIFASILKVSEKREFPIKNGNGNFDITWTGGTAGDSTPAGSWKDYVQSASVTVGLDGSSGQLTVDKYGKAGQLAVADQNIGAITLEVTTGANDTTIGSIFKGLGMGIADNRSTGGANWTVPLIGLEKKMDDMALINVPFFDGETLQVVGDYLCNYAGLIPDYTFADPTKQLGVSEEVNAVRFDWKAGTTVKQALEEVMDDLIHHYVVRDGKVYFYELDPITGLPITGLGTDWEPSYPSTKVVMYDASPDFEDLRNEIVVLGLEQVPDGKGTEIDNLPTWPRIVVRPNIATDPDVPWARTLVRPVPGLMTMVKFEELADKLAATFSVYELIGKTTIPGNADIRPYDQWGDFVIESVTNNLDFKAKTWTTDLQFMRKTR